MTQTAEFIRRNRDVDFQVYGGKDTLIFGAMCHGAAGCVATTANFVPELVCSIISKYESGDFEGSREAQYELNPIRLAMYAASWPVSTKDMANIVGRDIGKPFLPNQPTQGALYDIMKNVLKKYT